MHFCYVKQFGMHLNVKLWILEALLSAPAGVSGQRCYPADSTADFIVSPILDWNANL